MFSIFFFLHPRNPDVYAQGSNPAGDAENLQAFIGGNSYVNAIVDGSVDDRIGTELQAYIRRDIANYFTRDAEKSVLDSRCRGNEDSLAPPWV